MQAARRTPRDYRRLSRTPEMATTLVARAARAPCPHEAAPRRGVGTSVGRRRWRRVRSITEGSSISAIRRSVSSNNCFLRHSSSLQAAGIHTRTGAKRHACSPGLSDTGMRPALQANTARSRSRWGRRGRRGLRCDLPSATDRRPRGVSACCASGPGRCHPTRCPLNSLRGACVAIASKSLSTVKSS